MLIKVNLDNTASDNLDAEPCEHVAKNLTLFEKFLISLSIGDVNVLYISSFNVIINPENNSLNLSNSEVGISDKFFRIKDLFPNKICF